jgi:hypothetical protein
VTVTWTSNQNADDLNATKQASSEAFDTTSSLTLNSVGDSVTFDEAGSTPADDQNARVVVNAEKNDRATVISTKECEI